MKCPPTGFGTESEEATAAAWPWFVLMDEVIGKHPSVSPPVLISSSVQDDPWPSASSVYVAVSPPPDLLDFVKLEAEKDDARERKQWWRRVSNSCHCSKHLLTNFKLRIVNVCVKKNTYLNI